MPWKQNAIWSLKVTSREPWHSAFCPILFMPMQVLAEDPNLFMQRTDYKRTPIRKRRNE